MIIVKGEVRFGDGEIERLKPNLAGSIQSTMWRRGGAIEASQPPFGPSVYHLPVPARIWVSAARR